MKDCPECGDDAWCTTWDDDDNEVWECLGCEQIFIKPWRD